VNAGRHELFVYYRVAAAHWRDALRAVQTFQQRLREEHAGLTTRVLRRPDERNAEVTLMETYACADPSAHGVDGALQARIEAAAQALGPWLLGERHLERFDPLD
jgi:Domain of unknown function (DUF4936)